MMIKDYAVFGVVAKDKPKHTANKIRMMSDYQKGKGEMRIIRLFST
jgi:hypothetical protein